MSEKPKEYKISPDDTHVDALVWETVVVKNGTPFRQVWFFEKVYFPCGRCQLPDQIKFMSLPTGVYKSCKYCGFAEGVSTINSETGEHRAELLEEKQITIEEAWALLQRHKSVPYAPRGLPTIKPQRIRRSNVPTI